MHFIRFTAALLFFATLLGATQMHAADANRYRVYVGTYTNGKSEGIYTCEFDAATGKLTTPRLAAKSVNPSFVAVHPNRKFLYAVNETVQFRGEKSGGVTAFSIDAKTGALTELNQQSSRGGAPCHLVVDRAGKNVLVANYVGGNVASLPIGDSGKLGPASSFIQHKGSSVDRRRQEGPHAHSINLDAANRFAFAADLGIDEILIYKFDPRSGKLTANDPPSVEVAAGAGPRHFAFHPNGKFAYVINELHLTVTAFAYNADAGELQTMQTISTLPKGESRSSGQSTAEVRVHPSGRFLYGSNRGHNTIAVYKIDQETGRLTHLENESTGGETPRNFFVDPTGKFLLAENQSTGTIVVFAIDPQQGTLTPTGTVVEVPNPVCIRMVPIDD